MEINTIDAKTFAKMFLAGAQRLEASKEWINELNVFPVPDGDTGTNMTMTIMSAAKEVSSITDPDMRSLCKAVSSGSLRGARGNSGVILSQLFRGFTKIAAEYEIIDVMILANAMQKAVETAYKAVMKPKEGTILTVAKGVADRASEMVVKTDDIVEFAEEILKHGDDVLNQTPEMLPVLKQAGVVDSGGQGLMQVLKGAFEGLMGKEVTVNFNDTKTSKVTKISKEAEANIKFGYCTEFIVVLDKEFNKDNEHEFKKYLGSIGDSLVVVADDEIVKVHVHTNAPGLAIQKGLTFGALTSMKIDNMREEHQEKLIKNAEKIAREQKEAQEAQEAAAGEKKDIGFIAVSVGEGINEIFRGLGADYIIEGGQTMNPSTEDMLNAIDKVNADNIFIFPNNKNIILAANQAKELVENKNVYVIPTKTVPQGITALINYVPDMSVDENEDQMNQEISNVKTGQVTYAVRDTTIDDIEIRQGDYMGVGDHNILAVSKTIDETTKSMIDKIVNDDDGLISIYYGSDIDEDTANNLASEIEDKYPDCDVETHFGGQPIYYYIVSVE